MKIQIIEKYKNWIGLKINSPLHKGKSKNFVFIHINKTAGTSIIKVIGKPFRKHLTVKEVIKVIGQKKWDDAYKFTVIRNPWDKVFSQYKHHFNMKDKEAAIKKIEFDDWVACTYGEHKNKIYYKRPQMFLPQVEWLKNYEGKVDVDKIIRYENLNEGINEVFKTLGINHKLPHLNSTYKTCYRDFYDEKTKKIISDWFDEDIKRFGYTF